MELLPYDPVHRYDEMFSGPGVPRASAELLAKRLIELKAGALFDTRRAAASLLRDMGITFAVYGNDAGTEKVWPFDIIPRVVPAREWIDIERGLAQRVQALNLFLADIYGPRKIFKDKVVPEELVLSAECYREACNGLVPPHGTYCHVVGTDLVRDADGSFYVLEDNLRVPSGVSYVLENRAVMKRTFPQVFDGMSVRAVEQYPDHLLELLLEMAPPGVDNPSAVVLTPGPFNSAYFEHSFLAQRMGIRLVQGSDLVVDDDGFVKMRTTRGLERVDVIYRRIDDDFLDPKVFRPESCLGVPGIMEAYAKGKVTLVNAPGTGVADDKAVYAYVPRIIKYYLDEEAILPNVPTHICSEESSLGYVLDHMGELVVKPTGGSGGYGILIGPQASKKELADCAAKVKADPRGWIAQPMVTLSTVPTLTDEGWGARHVDLRPFILTGKSSYVLPGGLTRVALKEGSMIVNSSQGGGSKDTWVLTEDRGPTC